MLSRCQTLRWSGRGISNGRQRLATPQSCRNLSSKALQIPQSSPNPTRLARSTHYITSLDQSRSISLFGWGVSKPADTTPPPSTSAQQDGFTVKASHSTSDTAEPSSIFSPRPMSTGEPEFLTKLEDRISLPSEFDPSTLEHFSSDAERIGYLREVCGLDFGWGTSTVMQSAFEYFHIYTGSSWTISIIAVSLLMRMLLIKFTIDAQMVTSRMREVQPIIAPLRERHAAAVAAGDSATMMKVTQELRAVTREANVGFLPIIKPILFQLPLSFGSFRSLRAAAVLPVPAFETNTFLWHTNLAMTDPFLPILGGALTFLTVWKSTSSAPTTARSNPTMKLFMQYVLPATSIIFLYFQAAAVQIFFLTQTVFQLSQTYLLANDAFRERIGLPPLQAFGAAAAAASPTGGLNTRPKSKTIDTTARAVQPKANAPIPDVSIIDKGVNAVKSGWNDVTKSGREKGLKKKQEQINESREYKRRQEIDMEREYRNQNARDEFQRKKTYRR